MIIIIKLLRLIVSLFVIKVCEGMEANIIIW